MIVVDSLVGCYFIFRFFKTVTDDYAKMGLQFGIIALIINWLLDIVILIPMAKITVPVYFKEIGLRYLIIFMISYTVGKKP